MGCGRRSNIGNPNNFRKTTKNEDLLGTCFLIGVMLVAAPFTFGASLIVLCVALIAMDM